MVAIYESGLLKRLAGGANLLFFLTSLLPEVPHVFWLGIRLFFVFRLLQVTLVLKLSSTLLLEASNFELFV